MTILNTDFVAGQTLDSSSPTSPSTESLLERVDQLLDLVTSSSPDSASEPTSPARADALLDSLVQLRMAFADQSLKLAHVSEHSEALACAQATAVVRSARMFDDLQRTKLLLSEAKTEVARARQDTKRLADTVLELTHDGVLVFENGRCTACNDNAVQLLGCARTSIVGDWPSVFETAQYEDGRPAAEDMRSRCRGVADGNAACTEVVLNDSDESTCWVEITTSAFSILDSAHVLMIVRDVTARKRFESQLRSHSAFLNNIINAVPDQITVSGTDHQIVVANDAFCEAHGIQPNEVVGQNSEAFLPRDEDGSEERELLSTGNCQTTEHEFLQPDGSRAIVSVKRSCFQDESNAQYIVATSRDITEDRMREDRLQLFASVFDGASEGVAILSTTGHIQEANPAFIRMTTAQSSAPIGQPLVDALNLEIHAFKNVLQQVVEGHPWSGKAKASGDLIDRYYWVSLSSTWESDDRSPRIIALVSDITDLENTQSELRRQALYDNLTGLPNRRFFRDHLHRLVEESKFMKSCVTICFLDLDDFKLVNDSAGHSIGDRLLQAVGVRIQETLGDGAFVARFGGDEFAIIVDEGKELDQDLLDSLERLLAAFREPFKLQGGEAVVGLSIGVTSCPQHASDVDSLMSNADIAMYAAKSAGKNRIRVFTPEMQEGVNLRHQVQSKLRRALTAGEISLCFQPKVCAETRRPIGCEALARWKTADGTFVPPSDFIPIAEQTGLILPLGEMVFHAAAEHACQWHAAGHHPYIAVNISPNQVRHPRFLKQLETTLRETGARAEWFELEITEHAMMDDVDHAITVIDELASMGFRVAVDDFGTGYCSLSYLKSFNIHTLKVDLSFVRDVTHDSQSHAIVRSIVSLGTGLGLNVVAEGVETAEQADVLYDVGCTVLQGYLIGKPMSADDYLDWLSTQRV